MISYLRGKVVERGLNFIVIDVSGLGYKVWIAEGSKIWQQVEADNEITVFTSQYFREDEQGLFGFSNSAERNFFELLTTVSGVGPRLGSQILSSLDIPEVARMIVDEDIVGITKVPGIGKKMAERIILELRDKVLKYAGEPSDEVSSSKRRIDSEDIEFLNQALTKLGFSPKEVEKMLENADDLLKKGKGVEEVLSYVLGGSSQE